MKISLTYCENIFIKMVGIKQVHNIKNVTYETIYANLHNEQTKYSKFAKIQVYIKFFIISIVCN